ncbi:MAG: hypothetical protein QNJ57_03590 [Flavobacteriaceae bacterium]|nr:hypothetical protein [Flavobacteriaceae bacterium]
MIALRKYVLFFIAIPLLAFSVHKYYISFTKITYAEKSEALQIIMRVFTDDLQNGLEKQFTINTALDTDKELETADEYISKYVADKFSVIVNGKKAQQTYIGKKYDADETKIYIEIENVAEIQSIEVQNKVLMELFEDQQNIIKLKINNKRKSFILTSKDDKDMLKF